MESDRIDVGQAPPNKQPSGTEETDTSKPVEEHGVPTPSEGINKLQSPPASGNKPKTKKKHRYTRDHGMFWVSVATLIVVAVYAWYARQQAIEAGKTANAAMESADAAKAAVKVAEETLKINKEGMEANLNQSKSALQASIEMARRDQRAWMGPREVTPSDFKEDSRSVYVKEGEKIKIGVVVANSGKTPARKFRCLTGIRILPATAPFVPYYSKTAIPESVGIIQPGARAILPLASFAPLTKGTVDAIKNNQVILYAYGMISYEDIFGVPHKTTFCMSLEKDLSSFIGCDTYEEAYKYNPISPRKERLSWTSGLSGGRWSDSYAPPLRGKQPSGGLLSVWSA